MRSHLFQLVLRQYIEHKNVSNLRVHVWSNAVLWMSLATLLSQFPVPIAVPVFGANIGAWWVIGSVAYWLSLDARISLLVLVSTIAFASLPIVPWGPENNWVIGIVLPMTTLVMAGLVALLSHIYHHEHAEYLKTDEKLREALETTHAVLWGPFHFWLCALLRVGYRPALRAELDSAERRRILRTTGVPWSNWAQNVQCRPQTICVPLTLDDLSDIVRDAAREGRKIRMVAGGFNLSSMAASDDTLVFCERLNRIEIDSERQTAWVECGTTNRQLNGVLNRAGLQLPWNVVMENVRVGGIVSTGTHGSGKNTATMGDLVMALDVIDANGERRILSEETVGRDAMDAARTGFGMFGVIARVKLRIEPAYRVLQVDRRMKFSDALKEIPDLVRNRDSVELFWFPYTDWIWVRTFDRTEEPLTFRSHGLGFLIKNLIEMLFLLGGISVVSKKFPSCLPSVVRSCVSMLGFHKRVVSLTDAVHYRRWIELKRTACVEVGFKIDESFSNFCRAFDGTRRLVDEWASKGHYPLDLTVNIRFVGPSRALLSPAYGPGLTCYIEALFTQRSREWKVFTSELYLLWLSAHPSALPHWAKEFEHVPGIEVLAKERLDGRLTKFRAALQRTGVDPNGMFINGVVGRVFGI